MRVLAVVVLVALAGCSQTPQETVGLQESPEAPEPEPPVNGTLPAPVALLAVDALNGTAPLRVNFTIEAEGNTTAWSLDFGDGNATSGTTLPATAEHTYANGTFVANLTVSGPGGNASATLQVHAAEVVVAALEPFEAAVSLDQPCPGCGDGGTSTCTWRAHGNGNAQDCAWIDFPDELAGQPFTLTGNGLDADLLFWESCNSGVGPKFHGSGNEAGTVPEGMGCVLVWEQLDALITLTFAITPEAQA